MVKLRLIRLGKKKQPFYRIVAMDNRSPRNGKALANIGTYDPMRAQLEIDEPSAQDWLRRGAKMSETVEALLHSQGVLARWRGFDGRTREDVLSKDKPARRRKLGVATTEDAAAETETTTDDDSEA